MTVRFILGRSGTGKTHYCIQAIVEALLKKEERPLLFLVPEQATYQSQRAILSNGSASPDSQARRGGRITGYNRLQVLSFDRLVYLVGGRQARPAISRLGRAMVVQRVLADCADKLTVFGGCARLPGLGRRLADTISRLQQYANDPDDVKDIVGKLQKQQAPMKSGLTAAKLNDISVVFEQYLKFIKGKFLDPDIQLRSACAAVGKADFVRGAKLWVDGFAGFTTNELALLTELLKNVDEAEIALCFDPGAAGINLENPDAVRHAAHKNLIDPADLFGPTLQTYCEFFERIKKCKLKLIKPLILDKPRRFLQNPALAHVERNIFTSGPTRISSNGKIRIISATNPRAEVQFVARQIVSLVRQAGFRYRDIAVIAPDIDAYEHYIKACFEDYDIPVFIDKRKPLHQHPLIELLLSALSAVINGFSNKDVFAYLKTDLLGIERDGIFLLENYCIAFGITYSDWTGAKQWQYAGDKAEQFSQQHANEIRQKVISPLLQLQSQLAEVADSQGQLDPRQFTKIIFDFIETTGARRELAEWVEEAIQRGDFAAADEHRQVYDRLVDIFDELNEAFAGLRLNCTDYVVIINSAFAQMTLAFIPPNLDQVLVGSIERSRHPNLKAVFLIGATEKQFPSPVAFDSILSEDDRLAAGAAGLELSPGVREELAHRAYLAYIAFTRASDLLYISYPAAEPRRASAIVRSPFIDNLCLLFNDLEEESPVSTISSVEDVLCQSDLDDLLCFTKDDRLSQLAPRVTGALAYENKAELSNEIVKKLFANHTTTSSSRLSTFAACPYRHFAKYVLELKKRDEFKLEPLDVGDFYHRVLDGFTKRVVAEKLNFETVEQAKLNKILNEEAEKLLQQDTFIAKFTAHGPHNSFVISEAMEYLLDYLADISQMIRAGCFRPALSEVAFGDVESAGPGLGEFAVTLSDGRQLLLNGRIDRIDIAQINRQKIALIFDYKKRSKKSFNWAEFFYGLDMQLPIYILALLKSPDSQKIATGVAGAFYLPIEAGPEALSPHEIAEGTGRTVRRAKGLFNGEYYKQLDSAVDSGWSNFYSFQVTEDKGQYANYDRSSALRPGDFEAAINFAENKIAQIAQQILSGQIEARPYRLSGRSPCAECEYKPVCRFDWQINDYNLLTALDKRQTLETIKNADDAEKN